MATQKSLKNSRRIRGKKSLFARISEHKNVLDTFLRIFWKERGKHTAKKGRNLHFGNNISISFSCEAFKKIKLYEDLVQLFAKNLFSNQFFRIKLPRQVKYPWLENNPMKKKINFLFVLAGSSRCTHSHVS